MKILYTSPTCKNEDGWTVRYRAVVDNPEWGHCVYMVDEMDREWIVAADLSGMTVAVMKARKLYRAAEQIKKPARAYA